MPELTLTETFRHTWHGRATLVSIKEVIFRFVMRIELQKAIVELTTSFGSINTFAGSKLFARIFPVDLPH